MKVTQSTNNSVQTAAELQRKTQGTLTAKEVKAADAAKAEAAKKAAGTTIPGSVNASFSAESKGLAKDMATAKTVASQTADVREEKVAELKRRIAAGKYNVDATAVADRMVDDHLQLRGT